MTTYGSFPGVQVTTQGGGISGVTVGGAETLVLFGPDSGSGTASVEEPTQIRARTQADPTFGEDSELANAVKDALANGANIDFLHGVKVATSQETESFSGSATGTLANAPIVEDDSVTTVTGTSGALEVEFRYDSAPAAPTDADTIYINPLTGEWAADEADDYDVDYEYADWSSAFDSADSVVNEDETGVYAALSEAESVADTLSTKVSDLRQDFKFVQGVSGAQPNANSSDDPPRAEVDPLSYTDEIDSDSYYLVAPARQEGSTETIIGGVGGLMAGHEIDNPIYNDQLENFDALEQSLTKTESDLLRDQQVIPVRDAGSIRVKDNLSTSTDEDWERDFWRRRIVDRVVLLTKQVGDNTIGQINDERTRTSAETRLFSEIAELVNDRLLRPNGSEQRWFVDVYQADDPDQVNIDVGITPYGIAKRIDETVTVNT